MKQSVELFQIDFGQPETEHDSKAIANSFYEAPTWKSISSGRGMPFIIGRKGSGKSATAARLELIAKENANCCFIRFVPADFRHVEIRDLLANLVSKSTSWQYIYRKVWEGIILGQIVKHFSECQKSHNQHVILPELSREIARFKKECGFYVAALGDALSEVITTHVSDASKKTDALSQVALRKMLEPYDWRTLTVALEHQLAKSHPSSVGLFIAIDGLDEHWDTSEPSLYFLAELLAVTKVFTAKFGSSMHFVICLRDSIFRGLVDTKSIEYDKIESLIINLEWNTQSLFELIARRVEPNKKVTAAVVTLKDLLPESIHGMAIEEFLARYILQRPRDYINFFRMLQKECGHEARAGEGHIEDTTAKYCANRLVDLENEFGLIYPGISKCISALHTLTDTFNKEKLLEELGLLCLKPSFRTEAAGLMTHYGQPLVLARILLSIGVIGTYNPELHTLRFVHEFSESRVNALWESADVFGFHPVYHYKRPNILSSTKPKIPSPNFEQQILPEIIKKPIQEEPLQQLAQAPAILAHPADYLAEKDSLADLEPYETKMARKRNDLLASLTAIDRGQPHFRRFELWIKDVVSLCFIGDLLNAEEQIVIQDGNKKFEMIFDIMGNNAPWPEVKGKYRTHRLLVECKNTDEPTDADFNKLNRDMLSLDVHVAFLAYRGVRRESTGKVLEYQRASYINSNRENIIVAVSEVFLTQCLTKKTNEKCRNNLNALWRDHVERWLPT